MNLSEYRIGIKFDKEVLDVEHNNYFTKIVNLYILYDLDAWPKIPLRKRKCFFRATNVVKYSDKEEYIYSRYGIEFDGKYEWRFGNVYAMPLLIGYHLILIISKIIV